MQCHCCGNTCYCRGQAQEDGDLIYAGEYLDIAETPKSDYAKRLRVRRLVCRVCKLKFRTRQETQEHIRREHRVET